MMDNDTSTFIYATEPEKGLSEEALLSYFLNALSLA